MAPLKGKTIMKMVEIGIAWGTPPSRWSTLFVEIPDEVYGLENEKISRWVLNNRQWPENDIVAHIWVHCLNQDN